MDSSLASGSLESMRGAGTAIAKPQLLSCPGHRSQRKRRASLCLLSKSPYTNFCALQKGSGSTAKPVFFPGWTDRSYCSAAPPPAATLSFKVNMSLRPLVSPSIRHQKAVGGFPLCSSLCSLAQILCRASFCRFSAQG